MTTPHYFAMDWDWAKPTTDFQRPRETTLRLLLTCHLPCLPTSLVVETVSSSHSPCCPFTSLKAKPSSSSFVLSHTVLASRDTSLAPWHPRGLGWFVCSCSFLTDHFRRDACANESSLFAHMVFVGFNPRSWKTTSPAQMWHSITALQPVEMLKLSLHSAL